MRNISFVMGIATVAATLLPVYIALLTWGALFLREGRLRPIVPMRS